MSHFSDYLIVQCAECQAYAEWHSRLNEIVLMHHSDCTEWEPLALKVSQ